MSSFDKVWPDYRAVWRWHFYAGLFCLPFVIVLSLSGSIYLFKPQIESWLERRYNRLEFDGEPQGPAAQVAAALRAFPGAKLQSYELPPQPRAAARVIVRDNGDSHRVYVHPRTLEVLGAVREDERFMRAIFRLHGELWLGERGSYLVELAASWTIVMVLTGLVLWWPRQRAGMAGIVYPRLRATGRVFWRDLHSVTGFWVSAFALVLLFSGLPWSKFWGEYFKSVRRLTGTAVAKQDWSTGREPAGEHSGHHAPGRSGEHSAGEHKADEHKTGEHKAGEHSAGGNIAGERPSGERVGKAGRGGGRGGRGSSARDLKPAELAALDTVVSVASKLELAAPVVIAPPASSTSRAWSVKSMAANRPRRENLTIDGTSGEILTRDGFRDRHWIDKIVAVGIALHEGQLFGWPNQLLGLGTAVGLVLLSSSGAVLWWRRRTPGTLGAPTPHLAPRFSRGLALAVGLLAIYLPLFGLSLLVVLGLEWLVFGRIPSVARWLGLRSSAP